MNIDWAVAIAAFLLFVVWAMAFFANMVTVDEESPIEALEFISEKVIENLTVKVHSMPVKVNYSNESASNVVLYFEYRWPFGKETTKVYKDGVSQTCNITGNRLYWQSDLDAFVNHFTVKYSEQDASLFCTGGFTVVNETQVIPFVAEEGEEISLASIINMNATNYSVFKSRLEITRDFNITIENASTVVSYGLQPPKATDTFSKGITSTLEETDGNITIRLLTW